MQQRSDQLTPQQPYTTDLCRSRAHKYDAAVGSIFFVHIDIVPLPGLAIRGDAVVGGAADRLLRQALVKLPIVFATQTTEKLEHDDECDDADAGRGEHAFGGDVPGFGDEAWGYC